MKNKSKYHIKGEDIVKYLNNELSAPKQQEFEALLENDPENRKQFEDFKKLWSHSNKLSAIENINISKDWQNTKQRMGFVQNNPVKSLQLKQSRIRFLRIAATIIILLGTGLLLRQYLFTSPENILVQTGDFKKEITLPDGSLIALNKYSELSYPEKFKRKERLVKLSGEAFFEVTKNQNKKFKIDIEENAMVEVLGTSFNIKSEKVGSTIDVNVVSGKVAFYTPANKNAKTILTKNENAFLQNGVISDHLPKDKNFLSWRTGVLYFEDETIENVCKALSEFYDKEIIAEGLANTEIRFTSIIDNQKLESVLEEIKLVLNLDYSITEQKITIRKNEVTKQ